MLERTETAERKESEATTAGLQNQGVDCNRRPDIGEEKINMIQGKRQEDEKERGRHSDTRDTGWE